MTDIPQKASPSEPVFGRKVWRLVVLALVVLALQLPINDLPSYGVLLVATAFIFSGRVIVRPSAWILALLAVLFAALLPMLLAPKPIDEGGNVFLPGKPGNVQERQLPPDVYRYMQAEFDALYPASVQCAEGADGCWKNKLPDRVFGFSADSIFSKPTFSRTVNGINFSDPVWLRLGFLNDIRFNWYTGEPDVHRADRDRRFWMGLWRWRVTAPWFEAFKLSADYVGAELCWRGDVMWPDAARNYSALRQPTNACRTIAADDIGRDIYGIAIKPGTLAMRLHTPARVQVRLFICGAVKLLAALAVMLLLIRTRLRDVGRPFMLIGLALAVIAIDDASFLGGWRPMDGGDDGLFYISLARDILQHLLNGNVMTALAGGENVFYYGGPGLRYLLVPQMILFGDSLLGYLALVLLMPILFLALFKRFLSDQFAWRLALLFTALPLGEIFGTSFFHYAKWAARGFADPAAHIFLIWGVLVIVGAREGASRKATSAAGGALLLALAVFVKPIVAPLVGILLGGAALAALSHRQWPRVAGLCIGFVPVLFMPFHNLYFGGEFVLFSSNARLQGTYVMPPLDYVYALVELVRLDFAGTHLRAGTTQIGAFLSGPSEMLAAAPLHAVAVAVVVWVTVRGRQFDPWLRLIGAAVIAEYAVDLIYAATPRYFYEMWLLTLLIVAVAIEQCVPVWLGSHGWFKTRSALERSMGHQR